MKLPSALTHLPREARDTLFMLAVIGWVVAPMLGELPLWCSLLTGAVMLWRGLLAWRGQPLPSTWWRLGLLALAMGATLVSFKTLLGRDAGVTLVVVLLALKTLELRAQRDAFVVFFLSFFLMLTNFFYSQSLLTAAAMLVALLGLLTALVNAHMPVGRPPLWHAARIAGGMTLLGAPIMVVLFLLFPRMAPLWGLPSDAMAGRSGLSAEMAVGNIASLALDDSVAMRVNFEGAPPVPSDLYFRGPVLSNFDGLRWRHADSLAQLRAANAGLQVSGPAVRYQVTLEPNQRPWLLTLDATPSAPQLPEGRARMTAELQWLQDRNATELLRYTATSYPQFTYGQQQNARLLAPYLALPGGFNPRTLALAQSLKRQAPAGSDAGAYVVQQALDKLRTGGYVYTLEPGVYGRDSADEFWFDRKAGFCEHIAAGFVILMRGAGVPARVVTGYQGGERNSVDGFWTVRQSDAHAWAEVWLRGQGWLRVDPTSAVAPSRIGSFARLEAPRGVIARALLGNVNPRFALNLRATWEAVNNRWNQWVLNYTQTAQLNLLKNIGFDAPSWEDLIYLLCAIVIAVSLTGVAWSAWDRQRQDPWMRLLARARGRLQRAGLTPPEHATARQLADQLQNSDAQRPDAKAFVDWLLRLEALRYAPSDQRLATRQRFTTLQRELQQLRWGA
ncbi:MAG TPA: transglutaminaseTgpA domain-containing protein [Rhodoferax sp.]